MLSYAQNFEDVMLARALGTVESGFYVDVGAWHPWIDSVTAHFYNHSWRGINVEPMPEYAKSLRQERPRDITIEAAAARYVGRARFTSLPDTGLSAITEVLSFDPARTPYLANEVEVATITLDTILEEHAPQDIHFLKIDCEGGEKDALAGLNLQRFRPWIILVEAVAPFTRIATHEAWEPGLLTAAYGFAYFDGLNRFYLADERRAALKHAFEVPPNVFDNIELACHAAALNQLRAENEALQKALKAQLIL